MSKQPRPVRVPSHDRASTDGLVRDLPGDERHGRGTPRRAGGATRAAGVVTGALVLFASVATAAALAGNRPAAQAPPTGEQLEITGVTALRPDLLREQLAPDGAPAPEPHVEVITSAGPPPAAGVPETGSVLPPAVPEGSAESAESTGDDAPAIPEQRDLEPSGDVAPPQRTEVVRAFYSLLPGSPAAAAELLSPALLGGGPGDFVLSWATIRSLTLHSASERPDGSVLAVVSMEELTGGRLRVEQLFRFTGAETPRIASTEVLSAQRS
jgi:hypothetical protein